MLGLPSVSKKKTPSSSPETVADFVRAVYDMPNEIKDKVSLIQKCRDEVGIDVSPYDEKTIMSSSRATMNPSSRATRKDREAVARMRKTGITEKDLEYEKDLGYKNGWNSGFNFSICYGAAAIVLSRSYNWGADEIEMSLARLEELRHEEITAEDIMERAGEETGVDVRGLVNG